MTSIFGAQGVFPTTRGQPTTNYSLQPGACRLVPAGTWLAGLDGFSCLQEFDPVQGQWVTIGGESSALRYINSDGNNYRFVNQVGCVVGASVTSGGTGYTIPPVVTVTAGGSTFTAILGGAVGTAPTVTNGGAGYNYPPLVFLDPPPIGAGLQATGYATLTSGVVSSITVDNQGAGYTNVPTIYIQPDPRDTGPTTPASAVATLTGSGTVTGLLCTNYGTPLATLPTISFSSGSAAATAIMVRSISAYTVTTAGSGYSGAVEITALGSGFSASPALTNPRYTTGLVRTRAATIIGGLSSGALTTSGQVILDGGLYAGSSPTGLVLGGQAGSGTLVGAVGFSWAVPTTASACTLLPV